MNDGITDQVCTNLELFDVEVGSCLTSKYGLWVDLRTVNDNTLHGSGRRIENGADGITLQIEREAGTGSAAIMVYMHIIFDAQINIENNRLKDIIY